MNHNKSDWTTIAITKYEPRADKPMGGTYNRLDLRRKYKRQSWDEIVSELLDNVDKYERAPGDVLAQPPQ